MNWKVIDSGQYHTIFFWEEKRYFKYVNLPNATMQEEDFRRMMLNYADFVEKYQPLLLLLDTSNGQFPVTPELQQWVAKEIAPRTMSIKKIANLLSKEIFSLVSVEQMMGEKEIADFYQVRYFEREEEAELWLLEA